MLSEKDVAQLRLENFLLQHGLSIVIRLLENGARVDDVIKIARASLKIYPGIINNITQVDLSERREPEEIKVSLDELKLKIHTAIKSGIHRSERIKRVIQPFTENDWQRAIDNLIFEEKIEFNGTGRLRRYYIKGQNQYEKI